MQRIASPNTWTWALALMACLGMSMGQLPAWALGQPQKSDRQTTATPAAIPINDVALDDSGQLVGRVVDAQGQPRDGVLVVLRQGRREVARTTTDARGQFTLLNIPGGLYQLDAGCCQAILDRLAIVGHGDGADQGLDAADFVPCLRLDRVQRVEYELPPRTRAHQ